MHLIHPIFIPFFTPAPNASLNCCPLGCPIQGVPFSVRVLDSLVRLTQSAKSTMNFCAIYDLKVSRVLRTCVGGGLNQRSKIVGVFSHSGRVTFGLCGFFPFFRTKKGVTVKIPYLRAR